MPLFGARKALFAKPRFWLIADGVSPTWYADFVASKYKYRSNSLNFAAWLASLGGTYSRASTASYFNSSGVIAQASSGALRFDYDPVTLVPKGILLEGARTNLATYSGDMSNGVWSAVNLTKTAAAAVAPDGTTSYTKLEVTTTAATYSVRGFSGITNQAYTWSVFAKKGSAATDGNVFAMYDVGTATTIAQASINYDTGELTVVSGTWSAQKIRTGEYRIRVTATASGLGDLNVYFGWAGASDTVGKYNYVWGGQLEAGSFASSYIPATSGSATRAADSLTFPTSPWFNASAGTFFAEVSDAVYNTSAYPREPIYVSNTVSGEISFSYYSSDTYGRVGGLIRNDAGTYQSDQIITTALPHKMIRVYAPNDSQIAVNGTLGTPDTTVTLPTNMTLLTVTAGVPFGMFWIKKLGYWPFRVTNAELQRLTT